MNIVITGATGFIGQWLLSMNTTGEKYAVVGQRKGIDKYTVGATEYDYQYTDYSLDSLLPLTEGADALIHMAAVRTGPDRLETYLPNIAMTSNLLEACRRNRIRNIVIISSITVYSDFDQLPWKENQPMKPGTLYGYSKAAAEMLAEYYNTQYGMAIKTLRMPPIIGVGEHVSRAFGIFVNRASRHEAIPIFGRGAGSRQYLYVKDAVHAIHKAVQKADAAGAFNIGMEQPISYVELAEAVNDVFHNQGNLVFEDQAKEDVMTYHMDISKARDMLGWSPQYNITESLEEIKRMILANDH